MRVNRERIGAAIAAVLFAAAMVFIIANLGPPEKEVRLDQAAVQPEARPEPVKVDRRAQAERRMRSLRMKLQAADPFGVESASTVPGLINALGKMREAWQEAGRYYDQGANLGVPDSAIAGIRGLRDELGRELARAYPMARMRYAAILDEVLWEHNMDVAAYGEGNRLLILTAGIFADNGQIKLAHEQTVDRMREMGFTRVGYAWYRGGDAQYFQITPNYEW